MPLNVSFQSQGLRLFPGALDDLLESPSGEVGRYLARVGFEIVMAAKAQVGVDTGRLRDSIQMNHSRSGVGQYVQIGSDLDYALAHHEGTNAHLINRPGDQMLRFSRGGRVIYTHKVNHPGTTPNRYLSDNLRLVQR